MTPADEFTWLLDSFVEGTAGVTDAVAVSSDGLLMAKSSTLGRAGAEKVAALISGFTALGNGTAATFGFEELDQVIVAMRRGYLFVSAISGGSCMGVVANQTCDIGLVGYQTRSLVERAGSVLTPALITQLRDTVFA